jgi:hypothetical protein
MFSIQIQQETMFFFYTRDNVFNPKLAQSNPTQDHVSNNLHLAIVWSWIPRGGTKIDGAIVA